MKPGPYQRQPSPSGQRDKSTGLGTRKLVTLAKSLAPLSLGVDEEVLLAQPFSEVSPCPQACRPGRPACKSQHHWALHRIIEIKRFAGVDINSPKALASPLSRASAWQTRGTPVSLAPNSPSWSSPPQPPAADSVGSQVEALCLTPTSLPVTIHLF